MYALSTKLTDLELASIFSRLRQVNVSELNCQFFEESGVWLTGILT